MVNPQKNRSFLSRQGNSVAFRQSRGRPSARARLTAPLGQCFFALEARLTYPKRCCSARPLPADAPLLHFPLWSRGWRFVPSIRPNGDPQLTCSRAAFIFLDKLPRWRQHFAALVYEFRFKGAFAQDFTGFRRNAGNQFAGTPKKYLLCQTFLLSCIRLHPKGCERNKRDAYAEAVQRGKPTCYGHADKISPYVYSTRRKNVRYHQNRRQAIQGCRR